MTKIDKPSPWELLRREVRRQQYRLGVPVSRLVLLLGKAEEDVVEERLADGHCVFFWDTLFGIKIVSVDCPSLVRVYENRKYAWVR